ncbi:MAG: GNAT family acetyltransferase [Anaerolineae bacterium]|jgi:ribosomal protein S18 acetylase RimI-like enzyme|nr:GNAT family acetyltransferase [Anaerolineae bacterium]MBT7073133.1 GNAT family acetyltransferase [Anaerolineae bacterium]MBT7326641.1 GNAT family acetyltransferase [Anaerolineae bacterium]
MQTQARISIRPFSFPEDYKDVYTLWERSGDGIHLRRSDSPAEIEKKIARDPDLFLLAETADSVIGAVMGGFDGRRGMMYHLAVAPEYRRKGVANLLVDALEVRLKAKGCIRYYLLVTKDNEEAIRFYQARGWENMDDLYAFAKDLD